MSDDLIDEGADGLVTRRVLQLWSWLHHEAPAGGFERADVCKLDEWTRYADPSKDKQWEDTFTQAREQLGRYGVHVEYRNKRWHLERRVALTVAERQALLMALSVADPGPTAADESVPLGIGIDRTGADLVVAVADQLLMLLDAIADGTPVEISHRNTRRRLDPYGVGLRSGRWFVVGRDHDRDALRVFGLDREGPKAQPPAVVGAPNSYVLPEDFDLKSVLQMSADPNQQQSAQPLQAQVAVATDALPVALAVFDAAELRPQRSEPRVGDDWQSHRDEPHTVLQVRASSVDALVRQVLSLRTRARLLGPSHAVDRLGDHLRSIGSPVRSERPDTMSVPRTREPSLAPPTDTGGRAIPARRLMVISMALALGEARDGPVSFDELAKEANVIRSVALKAVKQYAYAEYELFAGEHTMGHGVVYNGLVIADDEATFTVDEPWWLERWQPTPAEALRLWVAGMCAQSMSDNADRSNANSNLRTACTKLATYLKATPVIVDEPVPSDVVQLRRLADGGSTLWLSYRSAHSTLPRDATEVDVLRVARDRRGWFIEARVRAVAPDSTGLSGGIPRSDVQDVDVNTVARFEVEHIVGFVEGDRPSERLTQWTLTEPTDARPIHVVLELDRSAIWQCDAFDLEKHEDLDHLRCRVRLTVPGIADLRTLLLGLGPQGRLLAPNELRGLQRELADTILAMYA